MAKKIKLEKADISAAMEEFMAALSKASADGKVSLSKNFADIDAKAELGFSTQAWLKMWRLVDEFSTEIAWHGVATRDDKGKYTVHDILVYPQIVSGATADTDQEAYQSWLYEQPDEVFNHLRFQGHSHVNMSTSPSGVDTNYYAQILEQMSGNMFYVFAIFNKKRERTVLIYDYGDNVMYENKDVTVSVLDDLGFSIDGFLADAKEKAKERSYKPAQTAASSSQIVSWSGWSGWYDDHENKYAVPAKHEPPKATPKKRKGKRKRR